MCFICRLLFLVFRINNIFSTIESSASASPSTSSSYSKEIEELEEKKCRVGKDFLIKDLSKNQLDALCKYFSKFMFASFLELATDIIPEEDKKSPEKIKKLTTETSNSTIEMLKN